MWGGNMPLNRGYLRRTFPIPPNPVLFTLMSLVIWLPSPQQIRSSKSVGGVGAAGAAGSRHTKSVKM